MCCVYKHAWLAALSSEGRACSTTEDDAEFLFRDSPHVQPPTNCAAGRTVLLAAAPPLQRSMLLYPGQDRVMALQCVPLEPAAVYNRRFHPFLIESDWSRQSELGRCPRSPATGRNVTPIGRFSTRPQACSERRRCLSNKSSITSPRICSRAPFSHHRAGSTTSTVQVESS